MDGSGTSAATLALTGGGHLSQAKLFNGTLSDATVTIAIADGTLRASYDGHLAGIDPSIPFTDARLEASLTGDGRVTATVRDLLTRTVALADYDVSGTLSLNQSVVRDFQLDAASIDATLHDSTLRIARPRSGDRCSRTRERHGCVRRRRHVRFRLRRDPRRLARLQSSLA